jgi:chromosome segregation ATPase
MVQAGVAGLDTPRTVNGDGTYLGGHALDFDISQEQSFLSPSKDNNLLSQLRNGRRGGDLRTPRSRATLGDRRNMPASMAGGEFTPLLKSATRNSARMNGKENVPSTPAFLRKGGLEKIQEGFSPLPAGSMYGDDSQTGSFTAGTPMPQVDSSTASTPMALLPRRSEGRGVLQDGNQLSLREQENAIDEAKKENFGLKLKIHFLEEALRKAGPGYSEAALKENTELKVTHVTMQKELVQYKKTLVDAEKNVDQYRQQILDMQEKFRRKNVSAAQQEELENLRQVLEEKEAEIDRMRRQDDKSDELEDKVHDLEADLREKDRLINDREDDIDNLKDDLEKRAGIISELETALKKSKRRTVELEEKAQSQSNEELKEAESLIQELERDVERLKNEVEETKGDYQEEELANKSITTKGLSRQIEEKANRLQDDLEDLRERYQKLEQQNSEKTSEVKKLQEQIEELYRDSEVSEQKLQNKLDILEDEHKQTVRERDTLARKLDSFQKDDQQKHDEKDLLQNRHDALTAESASLQAELSKAKNMIEDLEDKLEHEKTLALESEREVRDAYKEEIDRLSDEVEDLKAEIGEKERLYDDDIEKWESEKCDLEAQRTRAEEQAAGLQKTIDRLQQAEGTLTGKESRLQEAMRSEKERHENQEALLTRQINDLNEDIQTRRKALEDSKAELATVREELRLSQREQKLLMEKVECLEDEVEVLQTHLDEESDQANQDVSAAKHESESLRRQLQGLKQDLAKAEAAASSTRAELEAFRGDFHAGQGSTESLNNLLKEHEAQLSKVRQDKQTLQDQIGKVNIELHSLRSSNAELKAERDELSSQLRALKQQEEETFRLDQERVDLRTAKMKLDNEVRRLREENKVAVEEQKAIEKELQQELERASTEEARLNSEIQDLHRILRGSSEKRELATAKKTIQKLEEHILELESQQTAGDQHNESSHDLSALRHDLSAARKKEAEYIQREASQKDNVKSLKRQIAELERQAHEAQIARFSVSSPQSSVLGSAQKSELDELRRQLAEAHHSFKELRTRMKDSEREAARKLSAANINAQHQQQTWESEKDNLERQIDELRLTKDELSSRNASFEAAINRLSDKIDRLQKALMAERANSGEGRTIALERRDLHEMLRETQIQRESLEVLIKERENAITTISAKEIELRSKLRRVRDECKLERSKALTAKEQLELLEEEYVKSKSEWDAEKRALSRGVRFPNMSLSVNDESEVLALKKEKEEIQKKHTKELKGLCMQIEWMKARCKREEGLRQDVAFAKKFLCAQIGLYDAWYVPLCSKSFPKVLLTKITATKQISAFSDKWAWRLINPFPRRNLPFVVCH